MQQYKSCFKGPTEASFSSFLFMRVGHFHSDKTRLFKTKEQAYNLSESEVFTQTNGYV